MLINILELSLQRKHYRLLDIKQNNIILKRNLPTSYEKPLVLGYARGYDWFCQPVIKINIVKGLSTSSKHIKNLEISCRRASAYLGVGNTVYCTGEETAT